MARQVRSGKRITGVRQVGEATYKRRIRLAAKGVRCCVDCGLPLSRYNPDDRCGPCAHRLRGV